MGPPRPFFPPGCPAVPCTSDTRCSDQGHAGARRRCARDQDGGVGGFPSSKDAERRRPAVPLWIGAPRCLRDAGRRGAPTKNNMTRSSRAALRSSTGIVGVPDMNYRHYRAVLVAAGALCAAALAFSFLPRGAVPAAAAKEIHAAAKYRCPMHTDVVQAHEGTCPICNMKLVKMRPEPKSAQGAVAVPADKQGLLGIAVGSVERSAGTRAIRVPGRVTPDETRVYHINAGIEGSIRELPPITTGSRVHKDQILGGFYAPSAMSTMQIYLVNLSGYDRAVRQKEDGGQNEPISAVNLNLQQRLPAAQKKGGFE